MPAGGRGEPVVLRGPRRMDLLRDETLPGLFAATAARGPERPALIWGERVVSYGELHAASNTIAAALNRRGTTAGKVVGLLLPRGADLLIAQLGITKSGAAWLPFDSETPIARVQTCLQSAGASGLVACRACLPRLDGISSPVWTVEDLLAEPAPALLPPSPQPRDPAYVIYTSGSTGAPKGIVISHRSICHFLRSENELLGVREDDRVYQGFSVAFDMSFEEIWISYLVGATLWIAPPSVIADPDALAKALTRERITVLHAVPTLLGMVDDPLPGLRLINLGGEACPDALAQRLVRPGRKVFNTYGPTETTVTASLAELKSGEPVTIGRPLPNYGMLVVDEQRSRPLPAGAVGELCIFGPGLATGYLAQPELTAQRFVANPLAADADEARMYLTGDLARIDPGGPVHCLGRADHQVKIRGFRVELDEIASALQAQPGVAAAAVVLRPLAENDELVAFVVPAAGSRPEPGALRQALVARLPHYMVPAHVQMVGGPAATALRKVDLRPLRTMPLDFVAPPPGGSSAPRNEEETVLFAALEKILPGRALHPGADFFDDLGGHSLLVARLVSLLRHDARFAAISVQDVYRERRLAGIAAVMAHLREQQNAAQPRPMSRAVVPAWRRRWCGLAQAAVIPFFVTLNIADWLAPFFTYHYMTGDESDSIPLAVACSLGVFALARLVNVAVAIGGKRLLAGRLKAGNVSAVGRHLFSLVAGQPVRRAAGCLSAGLDPVDVALPAGARRADRARCHDRQRDRRRPGAADHRGRREHRHLRQHRECARRGRRTDPRPGSPAAKRDGGVVRRAGK
jgi:amino acid adenylation domain-containing protein